MSGTEQPNLLDEWYKEGITLSSIFSPQRLYAREKVEFIYNTLLYFFGARFFTADKYYDKSIARTSWIISLITNTKSTECYTALYEVCCLIEYSKGLTEDVQKELQDLKRKNPENLRTFFFELFIYSMLDTNKIENSKKVISGNQILEGTCVVLNTVFLFECRKVFLPNLRSLDLFRRVMTSIQTLQTTYPSTSGLILTIKFVAPISNNHYNDIVQKLKQFYRGLAEFRGTPDIQYTQIDGLAELIATNYDQATLIELKSKKNYDILNYTIPPEDIISGIPIRIQNRCVANFSLYRSKIYEKLESILKEKKKQHKKSEFNNKILFVDNEMLPEFQMNLFPNESIYDFDEVKKVYYKVGFKDILVIIRRTYDQKKASSLADIIYPKHLKMHAEEIARMIRENKKYE